MPPCGGQIAACMSVHPRRCTPWPRARRREKSGRTPCWSRWGPQDAHAARSCSAVHDPRVRYHHGGVTSCARRRWRSHRASGRSYRQILACFVPLCRRLVGVPLPPMHSSTWPRKQSGGAHGKSRCSVIRPALMEQIIFSGFDFQEYFITNRDDPALRMLAAGNGQSRAESLNIRAESLRYAQGVDSADIMHTRMSLSERVSRLQSRQAASAAMHAVMQQGHIISIARAHTHASGLAQQASCCAPPTITIAAADQGGPACHQHSARLPGGGGHGCPVRVPGVLVLVRRHMYMSVWIMKSS